MAPIVAYVAAVLAGLVLYAVGLVYFPAPGRSVALSYAVAIGMAIAAALLVTIARNLGS